MFPYEKLTFVEVLKIIIEDLTYEDFNSSLKNNILDNDYRTSGDGLILFLKKCKQNKLTTLMNLLEYYNKLMLKHFCKLN